MINVSDKCAIIIDINNTDLWMILSKRGEKIYARKFFQDDDDRPCIKYRPLYVSRIQLYVQMNSRFLALTLCQLPLPIMLFG